VFQYRATVRQVHDGDTLRLDVDLGFDIHHASLDVRLLGIDCPELGRPDGLGERARGFVVAWFAKHGTQCVIETVRDQTEKYGRYLATIVSADGADLIADLQAAGLAKPYDGHGPRPVWP